MTRKLFIPKKCRVGFQHRADTFTNRLAYVIYYDTLGKIRKEKSWKGWCHLPAEHGGRAEYNGEYNRETKEYAKLDGIEPFDFPNEPTTGFVINKGIRRISWSHFGSGRSMCRIYDPRGIEFEITIENLAGLLMHTDCLRREIQGELVYAWCGGDLMLLPCNSEEYEKAKNYTELQAKRVGARELKEGATYVTKGELSLVYIGRHMWYEEKDRYRATNRRVGAKAHIFCTLEGKGFRPVKSVPSTIAAVQNEHPHEETANWIDKYLASPQSAAISGFEEIPLDPKEWDRDWDSHHHEYRQLMAYMREGDRYCRVAITKTPTHRTHRRWPAQPPAGTLIYSVNEFIRPDGSGEYCHPTRDGVVSDRSKFFGLVVKYENGHTCPWR